MLLAIEIPAAERGGNTYFVNGYAAFDSLSADLKQRICGKTIKQGNIVDTAMKLRPGASLQTGGYTRQTPGPSHPIISTHPETGCGAFLSGAGTLRTSMAVLWRNRKHYSTSYGRTRHKTVFVMSAVGRPAMSSSGTIVARFTAGAPLIRTAGASSMRLRWKDTGQFEAPDALSRAAHSRFQLHR